MRPSFFVGLVVAAGAALFGLRWLVSDPAPGEAPSQTAVEVRAGEQLALASGSWSASSADAATEFMPPTIKSERSPIEPESVAATESANVLHVIDESGAPLPDAELAAFVEDFTSWTRLEADEDGDIELAVHRDAPGKARIDHDVEGGIGNVDDRLVVADRRIAEVPRH